MSEAKPDPRLVELVHRWTQDALSAEELRELEDLLRRDEAGPRLFAEMTHLEQALCSLGPGLGEGESEPVFEPKRPHRLSGAEILALVALGAIALAILGVLFPAPPRKGGVSAQPPAELSPPVTEPEAVAMLTHALGLRWDGQSPLLQEGEDLPPGPLRLDAGVARVQFRSGADWVLEGPAAVDGHSLNSLLCRSGRFYARIPRHAGPFAVVTPRGVIVDAEAEFGLLIENAGGVEVHVFEGRLLFRPPDIGGAMDLAQGQAARFEAGAEGRLLAADASLFRAGSQLVHHYAQRQKDAFAAWVRASEDRQRDPRLLAFFDFDSADPERGVIPVTGSGLEAAKPFESLLVGAEKVSGRWPGKSGIAFHQARSRLRFELSGHHDALTLLMWVRPSALLERPYALLTSDGFDRGAAHERMQGVVQWRIHGATSQLSLETKRHSGEHAIYASEAFPGAPLRVGRWSQLGCVYDRTRGGVRHYIDGELVGSNPLQVNVRLELGLGEIGNSSKPGIPPAYFPGTIDEVSIYKTSVSGEEIREHYRLGRPGLD